MEETKDIVWFKTAIEPVLKNYEIQHRFYEEGDFGSLHQIIFNSPEKSGGIDFWGLGWLGIDLYDYKEEKQILNVLLEPHQEEEKRKAFEELKTLLKK